MTEVGGAATPSPSPRHASWPMLLGQAWGWAAVGLPLLLIGCITLWSEQRSLDEFAKAIEPGFSPAVGLLILPGLLCCGMWLRKAARLRLLVTQGRLTEASVEFQQRLWRPGHLLVGYRYVDDRGFEQHGRQVVHEWTVEGRQLMSGGHGLSAAHGTDPQHSWLVAASRFADNHAS